MATSAPFGRRVGARRVRNNSQAVLPAWAAGMTTAIFLCCCTMPTWGQIPLGTGRTSESRRLNELPAIGQADDRPFAVRRLPPVTPPGPGTQLAAHHRLAARSDDDDGPSAKGERSANPPRRLIDDGDDGDDASPEDDDDKDDDDDGDQVEQYLQELFLGMVVYPQEKNEIQFTLGLFNGVALPDRSMWFFEVEYGITDRLQIALELPFELTQEESLLNGMRNFGAELYYNFYSNRSTGAAYGVGFELGFPVDAEAGESRNWVYEPFFVAYRDFGKCAMNFSATLEIEDPIEQDEKTETACELAAALFRPIGKFVPIIEIDIEVAPDATPVRLAPGLYWHPCEKFLDLAISCPIGLNHDAPDIGLFLMAIVEFDAHLSRPGGGKNGSIRRSAIGR